MNGKNLPRPLQKVWNFFLTYVLTLKRFDLCVQGTLLLLVLLDHNFTLLLKRDAGLGHAPGNIHDWVSVAGGVIEFLFGVVLAWWGQARKNLALSMWLTATAASGLLVLAFPYQQTLDNPVELCTGEEVSYRELLPAPDPLATPRIALLVLTSLLAALTRLSVWCHGLTYLDDHEPENGVYFYGILISIRLSLGLNGLAWLAPSSVRDDWWHSWLSLCLLTLLFAFFFTLFPRRMEKYKLVDDEFIDRGLLVTFGRVIRNKTLLVQTAALACLNAAVFSLIRFDSDFVQGVFHIETARPDPRASRSVTDLLRSLVIVFFVGIFRTRFSVRRADGVKATTAARVGGVLALALAVPLVVLALLRCGVRADQASAQPACSADCSCSSENYGFTPVCELNSSTTYFSPCHAGCQSYQDLNGFLYFGDCSCGAGSAARGACTLSDCLFVFNVYQFLFALLLAMAGAALLMQGMVFLRATLICDKAVGVGTFFGTVALLSHVPGFLLYMLLSHLSCAVSHNSACLLHYPTLWTMPALSACLSVASGALSLVAGRMARGAIS